MFVVVVAGAGFPRLFAESSWGEMLPVGAKFFSPMPVIVTCGSSSAMCVAIMTVVSCSDMLWESVCLDVVGVPCSTAA